MSDKQLRVAITQRVIENETYAERRDALAQDWTKWAGAFLPELVLLPLPNIAASAVSVIAGTEPDLLILSGGNDLGTAPDRYETERAVMDWFREAQRPIIGVCRGLQLINDAFGGTVEAINDRRHVASTHNVEMVQSLAGLTVGHTFEVNSYHAFGVSPAGLAPTLEAVAISGDGYVEALVHPSEPILALQWHPERPDPSAASTSALLRTILAGVDSEAPVGR